MTILKGPGSEVTWSGGGKALGSGPYKQGDHKDPRLKTDNL